MFVAGYDDFFFSLEACEIIMFTARYSFNIFTNMHTQKYLLIG